MPRPRDEMYSGLAMPLAVPLAMPLAVPLAMPLAVPVRGRSWASGPSGPTNTVAPVVSGTTTVGEELSCTTGTWTGEGTISYAYQWKRDGSSIGSATASAYTLVEADEGAMISCTVTATDDNGSTPANSNSVGPIEAAAAAVPWSGYFTAAGITNSTAQTAIDAFAAGLESDGIQSKIKVFVILGGEAATAKNMMADAYHGSLVNSPTHTPWVGVRGNATDSYWSTGTALSGISGVTANSGLIGVFTAQDAPDGGNYSPAYLYAETYNISYESAAIYPTFKDASQQAEYTAVYSVNDQQGATPPADAAWGDLGNVRLYASRTAADALALYRGATQIATSSEAAVDMPTVPMLGAAANIDGTPSFTAADDTFNSWGYVIAEGLNSTEQAALDGRVATLRAALEALA